MTVVTIFGRGGVGEHEITELQHDLMTFAGQMWHSSKEQKHSRAQKALHFLPPHDKGFLCAKAMCYGQLPPPRRSALCLPQSIHGRGPVLSPWAVMQQGIWMCQMKCCGYLSPNGSESGNTFFIPEVIETAFFFPPQLWEGGWHARVGPDLPADGNRIK